MAGLNANVTLGSGVVPVPGQVNIPPGADEISFGDAFAEAQTARRDAADAFAAGAQGVPSAQPDRSARSGVRSVLPAAESCRPTHPIWASTSSTGHATKSEGAAGKAANPPVATAAGSVAGQPGVRSGSETDEALSTSKTGSARSSRRARAAEKAAASETGDSAVASPLPAGLTTARVDSAAAATGTATGSASEASAVAAAVGAVDAVDAADGTAAAASPRVGAREAAPTSETPVVSMPSGAAVTAAGTGEDAPSKAHSPAFTAIAEGPSPAAGGIEAAASAASGKTSGRPTVASAATGTTAAGAAVDAVAASATRASADDVARSPRIRGAGPVDARSADADSSSSAAAGATDAGRTGGAVASPQVGSREMPAETTEAQPVGAHPGSDRTPAGMVAGIGADSSRVQSAVAPAIPATPAIPAAAATPATPAAPRASAPEGEPVAPSAAVHPATSGIDAAGPDATPTTAVPKSANRAAEHAPTPDDGSAAMRAAESLRFSQPTTAPQLRADDAPGVQTVTSLPAAATTPEAQAEAVTPGTPAAPEVRAGSRMPGDWASTAVPVIDKSGSAGSNAAYAAIAGRAIVQDGSVRPIAPQADARAAQVAATNATGPAIAPDSSSPATPVTTSAFVAANLDAAAATPAAPSTADGPASGGISATTSGAPASAPTPAATPATPATQVVAAAPAPEAADVSGATLVAPRVIRHGGPSFAAYASDAGQSTGASDRPAAVTATGAAASAGTQGGGSDHPSSASAGQDAADTASANALSASVAGSGASFSAAASAISGAVAVVGSAASMAQAGVAAGPSSTGLADAAERLMNQAVRTIHTFQTAAGPSLEARISDPNLGDVRLIVTGRAGEIVQAQLVVRDRISADAIAAAATRMRSSGDGLAGVNLTVRSEAGGSSTNGRSGSNAFESAGWAGGSGYGAGSGSGPNGGHGQSLDQNAAASGNGAGPDGRGSNGTHETLKPVPAPLPARSRPNLPASGAQLPGGSSLDVRA